MADVSGFSPSAAILGAVAVVAIVLTGRRANLRPEVRSSRRFVVVVAASILAQLVHFLEELRFGFFASFPAVFGLPPISEPTFFWFNAAWLMIWVVSLVAVRAGVVVATAPLWFLGLAMVLNLLGHPALAFRVGGYFPGLVSAPMVGLLGVLLLLELVRATAP